MHYVKAALRHLVPILLDNMTKAEDDGDEDSETSWNLAKASTVCLNLVAQTTKDDVLEHVMPFVNKHISSPDWRHRDAAILAFGNLLDGPHPPKVLQIVMDVLPYFLNVLKVDNNVAVKDSAGWAIGTICLHYWNNIPSVVRFSYLIDSFISA